FWKQNFRESTASADRRGRGYFLLLESNEDKLRQETSTLSEFKKNSDKELRQPWLSPKSKNSCRSFQNSKTSGKYRGILRQLPLRCCRSILCHLFPANQGDIQFTLTGGIVSGIRS